MKPPRKSATFAGSHEASEKGAAEDMVPVERMLSGDFGSPVEVLAENSLSMEQKRELFDTWLRDLEAQPATKARDALRESIEDARASLGQRDARQRR